MPRNEVLTLLRSIGLERGTKNEIKVYEAIQKSISEGYCPAWITEYTPADRKDDRRGIDGWFTTDVGKIPIQIKSSFSGKRHSEQRRPKIPIVVIHVEDTHEVVLQKCLMAIGPKRDEYLKLRKR